MSNLEHNKRRVELYQSIAQSLTAIITALISDNSTRQKVKRGALSILYNICELHTGLRPDKLI